MSVFTSLVQDTITIPHDDGGTVVIRKLAPKKLREAARASQLQALEDFKAMGGRATLDAFKGIGDDAKAVPETDVPAPAADPLTGYDQATLCAKGIVSWSYPREVNTEAIDDLDEDTLLFIARAVLKLSRPSLFLTPAEAEAARGNG